MQTFRRRPSGPSKETQITIKRVCGHSEPGCNRHLARHCKANKNTEEDEGINFLYRFAEAVRLNWHLREIRGTYVLALVSGQEEADGPQGVLEAVEHSD